MDTAHRPTRPTRPPEAQTMNDLIHEQHFNQQQQPRVCELYTGAAVMLRFLVSLGWAAAMAAECAAGCLKFLRFLLPMMALATTVEEKPWIQRKASGLLALIVVAGV